MLRLVAFNRAAKRQTSFRRQYSTKGALSGIRVLDLSRVLAGTLLYPNVDHIWHTSVSWRLYLAPDPRQHLSLKSYNVGLQVRNLHV
jgi:lysylphosphatidylglycerol synthetase-like protein (DUF2156 family)